MKLRIVIDNKNVIWTNPSLLICVYGSKPVICLLTHSLTNPFRHALTENGGVRATFKLAEVEGQSR